MRRAASILVGSLLASLVVGAEERAQRRLEMLDRGVIAVRRPDGGALVSWRFLSSDPPNAAFNLYRDGDRLTAAPLTGATCFDDTGLPANREARYEVREVVNGREPAPGAAFRLPAGSPGYMAVPLKTPAGYTPNDAAVGDLDGDGQYEIVLKQELRAFDNSRRGVCPGTTKLEAYRLDGALLWRIDLGKNIREGAHYTPFIVYDLDGDGRAEVAVRTAEGTVDGTGVRIEDTDGDGRTDYVNPRTGYVLEGPEFLSIFDGRTGKELARAPYIARGRVADWGDDYGNRVDRFLMGVGHFDGPGASLLICRGYYALTKLEAWNWRNGRLTRAWRFDTGAAPQLKAYEGQGNHNLSIGDVDADGRDEIVYGAMALDHDGRPLYNTGLGHGDALHLSDLDPSRSGLEVLAIHERARHPHGLEFRDARTGALLWSKPSPDVARGVALDIDPRHPGAECWAAGPGLGGLFNCKGERISESRPRSCNFGVWWDGDPQRELLDRTVITKWDPVTATETRLLTADGCLSNNGSKATPALCADILGDWREELILRSTDARELRIYSTPFPTDLRLRSLMQDSVYRLSVAIQNVGYNQPPHPSFHLEARAGSGA